MLSSREEFSEQYDKMFDNVQHTTDTGIFDVIDKGKQYEGDYSYILSRKQ